MGQIVIFFLAVNESAQLVKESSSPGSQKQVRI